MKRKPPAVAPKAPFDVEAYLASAGGTATVVDYRKSCSRALLLLARYGQANPQRTLPRIS